MSHTVHSIEVYERVMSLKGRVSRRAAARICKVSDATVQNWWAGGKPACIEYATRQGRPGWGAYGGLKRSRASKKIAYRRWGSWHPIWNPDPELCPVSKLWFHAADVVDLIDRRIGRGDAMAELDQHVGEPNWAGASRLYQRMRNEEHRDLFQFLAVENLLACLGLSTSDLPQPERRRDGWNQPKKEVAA